MKAGPWITDGNFLRLCDLVSGDHLVCVTGAGISSRLRQKKDPSKTLPQWSELLESLLLKFRSLLSPEDIEDCERLLRLDSATRGKEWPTGRDLTLAATIIRTPKPVEFDLAFRESVTNEDGAFAPTHKCLLDLEPAGILTFNYDSGHENAALDAGFTLSPMIPSDEFALRNAIAFRNRPFYLKAHGSLSSTAELILTDESYRQVFVKEPAYRAFVQNTLTNFNLLFVGFKINDPDFDLFIDTMARQFGGPLHEHVAIFHERERTANDIALRRRYGIHLLYITDFGQIPDILNDARSTAGPRLEKHLNGTLSNDRSERDMAHIYLRNLGPAGKQCASNCLIQKIEELEKLGRSFELSEVAYSLGIIDAKRNKQVLIEIVERASHADPVGRALTVLRQVLELADIPLLERWLDRFKKTPPTGAHADRIEKYLEYLLTYIPAKFRC